MATREVPLKVKKVNLALLHEQVRAAVGERFYGMSSHPLRAIVDADAPPDVDATIAALAAAHDPTVLTRGQQAQAHAATARQRVEAVPGWASWRDEEAVDFINANVTDLASAKRVLVAMARVIVALRDATWQ